MDQCAAESASARMEARAIRAMGLARVLLDTTEPPARKVC